MVFDTILDKLLSPDPTPEQADRLARLAYLEWLGTLPGDKNFVLAAMEVYQRAISVSEVAPAARVFCDLLLEATRRPGQPLALLSPAKSRRGGARARRALF